MMMNNTYPISNFFFLSFLLIFCIFLKNELFARSIHNDSQQKLLMKENMKPPKPTKNPLELTLHNDKRMDNYAWLRDPKWPDIKDPKILNYMDEEKKYTESFFKPLTELQEKLYLEMKSRIQEDESTFPIKNGGYLYYDRNEKGKDYVIHCRKKDGSEIEEILIDENKLAQGQKFFSLGVFDLSHDHQLLAYATDESGQERYTIRIKNLKTGEMLPDVLENSLGYKVVWHKKLKGFFYIKLDEKWRSNRVYFHTLGEDQSLDKLIYEEKDETFTSGEKVGIRYSSDKRYAFFDFGNSDMWESQYIDLEDENVVPQMVSPRKKGHRYRADYANGYFYMLTNDKGSNYRIVRIADTEVRSKNWEEIITHQESSYLTTFSLYQDHLVYKKMEDGLAKIMVKPLKKGSTTEEVPFLKEESYEADFEFTSYDDKSLRIIYTSLATPEKIYEYNLKTKELHLRKNQTILGGFDPREYHVERIKVPSKDGTLVPISLVYKKSLKKASGGNPVFLDGYGAYGLMTTTHFSFKLISLLDRGFIYAIPHVRGGSEMGYQWYKDGKLLHKKHTFEDFIAASECLIEKGYTVKKNIAILGESAGGMLAGYCANERPDLYRAIIARVPFVDVLNTMLDGNLPLTPGEYNEWGNPAKKKYYDYIKSYSPYDNVKAQEYPAMYVTGGLHDQRVTYWEPLKWVAKLREFKTDKNVLLLDMKNDAGHFGPSGRFSYIKGEAAKYYAFLLNVFNIKEVEKEKGFFETCKNMINTIFKSFKRD